MGAAGAHIWVPHLRDIFIEIFIDARVGSALPKAEIYSEPAQAQPSPNLLAGLNPSRTDTQR